MTANAPCLRETTHTRRNVRYCFVTTGEDAFRVRGALINMPLVSGRYVALRRVWRGGASGRPVSGG